MGWIEAGGIVGKMRVDNPRGIKSSNPALTDEIGAACPDRDGWKLASYEVAGVITGK